MWLKQSTAVTVKMGPFLDSTDGNTQETALTISQADIRLSKNGGAYAQTNNVAGATHDEKGNYGIPLDTTDTNTLGTLRVHIHETGALPVWQDFMVVPANVWDSLFGADLLQVDLQQWIGVAPLALSAQKVQAVDSAAAQASVCTEARLSELDALTPGKAAAEIDLIKTDAAAILVDTGTTLDGRIPAALVGGRMAANAEVVGDKTGYAIGIGGIAAAAFAAGALDAAALATDAANEIRDAIKALVVESQGSYTLQQVLSIILSVLAGVTADSGATLKTPNGLATRVAATVNASNERTAMTLTPSA